MDIATSSEPTTTDEPQLDQADQEALMENMGQLLTVQREHLKAREGHMDIMREALADLTQKREELVSLRSQVSDAMSRNDIHAVNEVHSRITVLEESQSKFAEMLEASQAIRASNIYSDADGDIENEFDSDDNEEYDEEDLNHDLEFSANDTELSEFISKSLASLMLEVNAIDAATEDTPEASQWVEGEREFLIAQLEELQRESIMAHEARTAQIAELQKKQAELESFKKQILMLEAQAEADEVEELLKQD
ncbi:hypothetical protein HDU98_002276 [Podochytrium sp. JEL0797]|nr:hypothetical protein HDU98_002276 [Podochytrium sp. JEL0797]